MKFALPVCLYAALALTSPLAFAHKVHDERAHGAGSDSSHLQPVDGEGVTEKEIRATQAKLRSEGDTAELLERLSWLYVRRARTTQIDAEFHGAQSATRKLRKEFPDYAGGKLLEAFLLHQDHSFSEAAASIEPLVKSDPSPQALALYGDIAFDQGQLSLAGDLYQRAMDLRPGMDAYLRGAKLNWIFGDNARAAELAILGLRASSGSDKSALAWAATDLARIKWTANDSEASEDALKIAFKADPDFAPAHYLMGCILLAPGRGTEAESKVAAAKHFQAALQKQDLAEYQWGLLEALDSDKAAPIKKSLLATANHHGGRTVALYLATHREKPALSIRLAEAEFAKRQDIFTRDALAWALANAGRMEEAHKHIQLVLEPGYRDARIHLHSAFVLSAAGDIAAAQEHIQKANEMRGQLLPSERDRLASLSAELALGMASRSAN